MLYDQLQVPCTRHRRSSIGTCRAVHLRRESCHGSAGVAAARSFLHSALSVYATMQVLKVFGPHGTAIADEWCCCCGGYSLCLAGPCRSLFSRCHLCGDTSHRAKQCPNKFRGEYAVTNLTVPDGFCVKCFLPCDFTVAGVNLHDSGFTGARCLLPTRAADLLASKANLPSHVQSLPILDRYAWAFSGRRVPNIVQLLAALAARKQ